MKTTIVIGAGQAAAWGAMTLREEGYDGRILLLGDERHIPYERPPLSKEILLGKAENEITFWPADNYVERGIELRLGEPVLAIDPVRQKVVTGSGAGERYDHLLIATGSRPRTLNVEGASLRGIFYLRTIDDARQIHAHLARARRILVIGGGWIGLEVAAAARTCGVDVVLVDVAKQLCQRSLPPDVADSLYKLHADNGVDLRLGRQVVRFDGSSGQVESAILSDGLRIDADLVVVGIGVLPNDELAASANLVVDNGVVVDECGRTSSPNIYAAGDVTNHFNPILQRRIRLESWQNAQNQAIAAAKTMIGKDCPYSEVPWFWSNQFDARIQLIGLPITWDETITRGSEARGEFMKFYLNRGCVEGIVSINMEKEFSIARRLACTSYPADARLLADASYDLRKLLKQQKKPSYTA